MFSIGIIMTEMLCGWHPFFVPSVDDTKAVQANPSCGCALDSVVVLSMQACDRLSS